MPENIYNYSLKAISVLYDKKQGVMYELLHSLPTCYEDDTAISLT